MINPVSKIAKFLKLVADLTIEELETVILITLISMKKDSKEEFIKCCKSLSQLQRNYENPLLKCLVDCGSII